MDAKFYVPYETARELRLKGYPQQSTDTWYVEMARGVRVFKTRTNREYEYIARPTYHEVLDWIEKKGYSINSYFGPSSFTRWCCIIHRLRGYNIPDSTKYFVLREDALNAAILETLKKI